MLTYYCGQAFASNTSLEIMPSKRLMFYRWYFFFVTRQQQEISVNETGKGSKQMEDLSLHKTEPPPPVESNAFIKIKIG